MPQFQENLTLQSSLEELSRAESLIDSMLEQSIIPEEIYGNVLVASTEAILNAIHHGNEDHPEKTIELKAIIEDNALCISVLDQGIGFKFNELPDPTKPENVESLNGRGIYIIHNLADKVSFEQNGAQITMTFNLNVKELIDA